MSQARISTSSILYADALVLYICTHTLYNIYVYVNMYVIYLEIYIYVLYRLGHIQELVKLIGMKQENIESLNIALKILHK